jgi:phosphatidylglycerophosphate synthase|tara:strand:- start:1974 stop:2801 length:828 start_codon:yes stop_codon:yes gene_type:complete
LAGEDLTKSIDELKRICFKGNYEKLPVYPRYVTHKISIRIVRLLLHTSITPNQITLFSIVAGMTSCILLATAIPIYFFIGALILELYYVIDAVDGQLARYKKLSSMTGGYLDYVSNYIVHPCVFFCIGLGILRCSGNILPIVFAFSASVSVTLISVFSECKYNVFVSAIKKASSVKVKKIDGGEKSEVRLSAPRYLFSLLHKLCTYPTIMNSIVLVAIFNLFIPEFTIASFEFNLPYILVVFYGLSCPLVFFAKLAYFIRTRGMEKEFSDTFDVC